MLRVRAIVTLAMSGLLLVVIGGTSCAQIADSAGKDILPIIDAHMHLNADMSAERLISLMDQGGVRSMVLMTRYYRGNAGGYGSDEQALEYAAKYPGRFIPFIAGQRPELAGRRIEAWNSPSGWPQHFEVKARTGKFYGLGEFIMYHHAYTAWGQSGGSDDVDLPVDSYLMNEVAKTGARYNLPVLIHLEGEPKQFADMIRLLEKQPNTKFIWAHNCGRSSATQIRELLARFANLYCDLGGMTGDRKAGYGTYWPRQTPFIHPIEDGSGRLYPEMKELFENFSDRFLVGTDVAHTPALATYGQRIERFRQLLSQLTPLTARRLAYQNAERLFGLEEHGTQRPAKIFGPPGGLESPSRFSGFPNRFSGPPMD